MIYTIFHYFKRCTGTKIVYATSFRLSLEKKKRIKKKKKGEIMHLNIAAWNNFCLFLAT